MLNPSLLRNVEQGHQRKALRAFYLEYLHSPGWSRLKTTIIKKRGESCEDCGKAGPVNCHHLTYERLGHEEEGDLRLLCFSCHLKAHGRRRWYYVPL